jgi:hypothetical protein
MKKLRHCLLRHSGEAAAAEFSRVASRVAVAIGEGIVYHLSGIRKSTRVGRVAVAVREGTGSFVRHSGEAAELLGS